MISYILFLCFFCVYIIYIVLIEYAVHGEDSWTIFLENKNQMNIHPSKSSSSFIKVGRRIVIFFKLNLA